MKNVKTIALINQRSFDLPATFKELDEQLAIKLTEAVIAYTGGSRLVQEVECILNMSDLIENGSIDSSMIDLPYTRDDISNFTATANACINGSYDDIDEETRDQVVEGLEEQLNDLDEDLEDYDQKVEELEEQIEELNDLDFDTYPEIYQWFSLDDRIIRQLEESNECIIDSRYWGRTTFGQSMALDHVLQIACYNLAFCWADDIKEA